MRVFYLHEDSLNKVLLELSNLKAENSRIPGLEEQIRGLNSAILNLNREKRDLCDLVSTLRDQINDGEEERTNAKHDENLMREKLKFALRERDILGTKVKSLEGMYESELGEIKNAEDVIKSLKQAQMEAEFLKKDYAVIRKEKEELRTIIHELKGQLNIVEDQRDHFETKHDKAHQELQNVISDKQSANNSQRQSIHVSSEAVEEIEVMRMRVYALEREKKALEEENMEMQERLDENIEKLYRLESGSTQSAGSKNDELKHSEDRVVLDSLRRIVREELGINSNQILE